MVRKASSRCRGYAGFSLIEMVIVIAVIAVIVGIAIPVISGVQKQSQITRAQGDMRAIRDGYQKFIADTGLVPDIEPTAPAGGQRAAVDALTVTPMVRQLTLQNALFIHPYLPATTNNVANWQGPYLNVKGGDFSLFKDPWGQPYYVAYAEGGPVTSNTGGKGGIALISSGPNAQFQCLGTVLPAAATETDVNTLFGEILPATLQDDIVVIITKKLK